MILFWSGRVRSGRVGSGRVGSDDVDSDNRANSAQFQVKLPDGAELGNKCSRFVHFLHHCQQYLNLTKMTEFVGGRGSFQNIFIKQIIAFIVENLVLLLLIIKVC